jgi:hypothetical protein
MITVKKISKTEIPALIANAYQGDEDLLDKYYNLNRFNLDVKVDFPIAVLDTLDIIDEVSKVYKLSYYKVIYQKKPIGYFVTFDGFLHSFAINKKYRKREILIGWFEEVKKVLGKHFICMLYDVNTRAINHLQKQGMKIVHTDEEHRTVTLQN